MCSLDEQDCCGGEGGWAYSRDTAPVIHSGLGLFAGLTREGEVGI